jgi:hypothetical protein
LNDGVTGSSTSSGDDDWTQAKDKISTISALRAANRALQEDPLDVRTMDPALVVYRFDAPYQQQQEQGEMQGVDINNDNAERVPFTVTLNKFNTVADHVSRQIVRSLFTLDTFLCLYHVWQFVLILTFIVVFYCLYVCVCVSCFFLQKKKVSAGHRRVSAPNRAFFGTGAGAVALDFAADARSGFLQL